MSVVYVLQPGAPAGQFWTQPYDRRRPGRFLDHHLDHHHLFGANTRRNRDVEPGRTTACPGEGQQRPILVQGGEHATHLKPAFLLFPVRVGREFRDGRRERGAEREMFQCSVGRGGRQRQLTRPRMTAGQGCGGQEHPLDSIRNTPVLPDPSPNHNTSNSQSKSNKNTSATRLRPPLVRLRGEM